MQLISYVSNCLKKDKLIRWTETCMPLKIYIAPFRWYKAKSFSFSYQQMVFRALEIWTEASMNKVSFNVVNNLNDSQINLDWRRVDRSSLGHCYFNFDSLGRLFSAEVQIGLSDGILHAQYQDEGEVFHTILHEIGHALGLDHSPYEDDIMFVPHKYGVVSISSCDRMTLKWLYTFPYGLTSQEILTKYNFSASNDLDHLVYKLENKGESLVDNQELLANINNMEIKDLDEEQQVLAELNKYNLSLQNINISPNIQEYLKKNLIQKNLDEKK